MGEGLDPVGREDPDHLALHPGRARQRPEQVEDSAGAELDPSRADVLHGAVVARRQQEAGPGLRQGPLDQSHLGIQVHAESGQYVGRSALGRERLVAVLGDRHAAAGDDELAGRRDVVGAGAVAAGPAGVDGAGRGFDGEHLGPHRAGRAGDLVDGFAANAQGHEQAADLARRRVARHDDSEGLLGLFAGQGLTAGCQPDEALEVLLLAAHRLDPSCRNWRRVNGSAGAAALLGVMAGQFQEVLQQLVAVF
jgi:hypothetical protein